MVREVYNLGSLNFSLDVSKAVYEMDILQNQILQTYLRTDPRFRTAFYTNYTSFFIQYLKDKVRLKEPTRLSVMGVTRSGKSEVGFTVAFLHQIFTGYIWSNDYICANEIEYVEKLPQFPDEDRQTAIFQIDEQKKTMFGAGSVAKRLKILDVQNITAIDNVSTISITPDTWANKNADYGFRTMGRDFGLEKNPAYTPEKKGIIPEFLKVRPASNRVMLYNLQESHAGGSLPLGCIYFPLITEFLPPSITIPFKKAYDDRKKEWVRKEQKGEGDILGNVKRRCAEVFIKDENYRQLKGKPEKMAYIMYKLGSEYTKSECEEIHSLTRILDRNLL